MSRHILRNLDTDKVTRQAFDNEGLGIGYETELACDIHPDAYRVIRAPIRTRSEQEQYMFWRRWSKLVAAASIAALVALLKLAGARSLT